MVFSNTIENTTEVWFIVKNYVHIPLRVSLKIMVLNGIEWYYNLPLRIPLSLTKIPLNGPMVLNGIQW